MRTNDSSEDIYNSLPIDLFTNDFDEYETDSLGSELENYIPEVDPSQNDITPAENLPEPFHEGNISPNSSKYLSEEENNFNVDSVSESLSQLNLESKEVRIAKDESNFTKNSPKYENDTTRSTMWISCVRCGKKNEIDCNFCGKCGLQIHKTVSIVEPEAEENLSPEVTRNIKYHYKRPVFCFGPRGNCFASFSSPSKSVRNVSKFQLLTLPEFQKSITLLKKCRVFGKDLTKTWGEEELNNSEWSQADSILKDITIMIAKTPSFTLDETLRNNLREYFANISPKDLGTIKMLATQDSVSYSRGEIDQIFHLLVIGKTMEACELSIKFNYWDHALIIAKTLDVSFYEAVMNRFLDSRFANGHPLRILYLIMTNNENSALEEIRNMINNKEMPLFVQEIWTILTNFLLRAKHESLIISKIFEDIAKCLFERKLFENSLVCFIISILSGTKSQNLDVLEKIDYLLTWFASEKSADTINFAAIHILNVFIDKIDMNMSGIILWRCQFIRLIYAQFLHDLGVFDIESLNRLTLALEFSKKSSNCGFLSLLVEESSILEARNLAKIVSKPITPKFDISECKLSDNLLDRPSKFSPTAISSNPVFDPIPGCYNPLDLVTQEFVPTAINLDPPSIIASNYSSLEKDLISNSTTLSPMGNYNNSPSSTEMVSENSKSPSSEADNPPRNSKEKDRPADNGGNVLGKLKSWFPVSKSSGSNQENQKQVTKAKMGNPNSFRYDEKLKKWVDDNDPSTFEEKPKLPPPPSMGATSSGRLTANASAGINFRAKKGKVKYFDPLNPDGPSSTQLQPSVPNFD